MRHDGGNLRDQQFSLLRKAHTQPLANRTNTMKEIFEPLLISQRIPRMLRFIQPKPKNAFVRIFQMIQSSRIIAFVSYAVALSSLTSLLWYKVEETQLHSSLFFCILYIGGPDLIYQWVYQRAKVCSLLEDCASIAEKLEVRATEKQLLRMRRRTYVLRGIVLALCVDASLTVLFYHLYVMQHEGSVLVVPYLPKNSIYMYVMRFLQWPLLTAAPSMYLVFYSTYLELNLYLTALFKVLGENLLNARTREVLNPLVDIHQSLMVTSRSLERIFSRLWANLIASFAAMAIWISYIVLLAGSAEAMYVIIVGSVLVLLFIPCALSELLSESCMSVGEQAYKNAWLDWPPDMRKDLVLMILSSQKPAYITAGIFGQMVLSEYLAILKRWYTMVQALLSIH